MFLQEVCFHIGKLQFTAIKKEVWYLLVLNVFLSMGNFAALAGFFTMDAAGCDS